ncbi:MAG: hypothetical protein K2X93_25790 [Candidatus Obscuribacterales bacterium]|nr:hypothetical protein [Candidatus Obscuribacterales bacterium]
MKILTALSVSIIVCLIIGTISIGKDIRAQAASKETAVKVAVGKNSCSLYRKTLSMARVKTRRL